MLGSRKRGRSAVAKTGPLFVCDYCQADISSTHRIRCGECADFDLCVSCFSQGVEVLDHTRGHSYYVIECVTKPVFDADWGADEELRLLEGVRMFGMGNWPDIADHVGTKTKHKCQLHYQAVYLDSRAAPLADQKRVMIDTKHNRKLTAPSGKDPSSPGKRDRSISGKRSSTPVLTKVLGYLPHRGEFDVEYENAFEKVIQDIDFSDHDTLQEKELKMKVLHLYNDILGKRRARREFVRDRGVLEHGGHVRYGFASSTERHIAGVFKPMERLLSAEQYKEFVEGLSIELELREEILRLQGYRARGMTSLAQVEAFEEKQAGSKKPRRSRGAAAGVALDPKFSVEDLPRADELSASEKTLAQYLKISPTHLLKMRQGILDKASGDSTALLDVSINSRGSLSIKPGSWEAL